MQDNGGFGRRFILPPRVMLVPHGSFYIFCRCRMGTDHSVRYWQPGEPASSSLSRRLLSG